MISLFKISIIVIFLVLSVLLIYKIYNLIISTSVVNSEEYNPILTSVKPEFEGLCLFDIDGTFNLNNANENELIVQYILGKNYAVGLCTAGAIYHPGNVLNYPWMPINLYNFMEGRNFDTFSNVGSGMLCGKDGRQEYNKILHKEHKNWGHKKGLALEATHKILGITDPRKVIMFDNDPEFIAGIQEHNPNFKVICVGEPCQGGSLNLDKIKYAFSDWV